MTWEVANTNKQCVFYLHGALHVFDAGTKIVKYTWARTGIRLIDQIRDALNQNLYPLFVAEGTSTQKMTRIRHSDFLSRAYRSFVNIRGSLFIYGHSLAANDEHILKIIEKGTQTGGVSDIFVSIYGDVSNPGNQHIISRAEHMRESRPKTRPLNVHLYDAASAKVWG